MTTEGALNAAMQLQLLPELDQIAIMSKALSRDWSPHSEHELRELIDDASRALERCLRAEK